ncbi:MAG: class I SAM-dependent methyltransferase [Massilia sp.]|nr:class I SAM-dependent methyltransferase [Massilia sp.]
MLLQCAALPLALALAALLLRSGVPLGIAGACLLQGALAAALSRWRKLAWWWLAIQWLFPVALLGAAQLQLPPSLFLSAFSLMLLVYWSTFRTQVPYYPSGRRAWDAVASLLPPEPLYVIDIGSGLGGLVLDLARRRPESTFVGIELAPLPWLISALRAQLLRRSNARFVRGDYEQLDLGDYDAVFAYLSPAAMSALWAKASAEMRPGALLLSYEFEIGEKAPDMTIVPTGRGPLLYGWRF